MRCNYRVRESDEITDYCLISTFVSIAFIVMAVYWLIFRPVSATAQRLQNWTIHVRMAERKASNPTRWSRWRRVLLNRSTASCHLLLRMRRNCKAVDAAGFRSESSPRCLSRNSTRARWFSSRP